MITIMNSVGMIMLIIFIGAFVIAAVLVGIAFVIADGIRRAMRLIIT